MVVMGTHARSVRTTAWLLTAVLALGATPLASAQARPTPAAQTDGGSPVSEADLNRIRKALDTAPTLNLDENQLRYYVRILARRPTFTDFMKDYDFKNGPTRRGNPMTHQEFLAMVTPKEMNSSGGITAMETLQFAFTNWLAQTLVKKAVEDLRNASSEREVQEIRNRIDRELAVLRPPAGSN